MTVIALLEGKRVVCLREVQNSIADSVKQLIEDIIERHGLESLFDITEREIRGPQGSVCLFRGLHNSTSASIKSLEGIDRAWLEEAQTISQRSLDLLTPTIRAEGSELWFSWNPVSRLDPIDKLLRRYTPKNAIIVESSWQDNKWFPKALKADMERDRGQDPEKASHIWDGEYASVTGGAYYASLIADARKAKRIMKVEYDPDLPVSSAWDLGIGDSLAIVLWQQVGNEIRVINHYENHSLPLPHYVEWLKALPYPVIIDWLPHDARVRELGTGLTRVEVLKRKKRNVKIVPMHKVDDGINAVRELLPIMYFDVDKCEYLLECLMQYREDYDERLLTLKSRPLHDWTSHSSDAIRYMCMAYKEDRPTPIRKTPTFIERDPLTINDLFENIGEKRTEF